MRVKGKTKVIVAMSGGVDSSVAAALLKRANFNVGGVFMKFWPAPYRPAVGGTGSGKAPTGEARGGWNRCCSTEAEKRARAVAQKLGIPFYVFNFEREFKKKIVNYFLAEYKAGRTPNPCVVCNKEIKFGLLLKKALALGADFVATGHYARLKPQFPISNFQFSNNFQFQNFQTIKLLQAKDKQKDQSYFLWQLGQEQLKHILFPVGDYTKEEVRALAKKFGLPTAKTKDSQEVCFIKNSTEEFLRKYLKEKPGDIITLPSLPLYKSCDRKICTILLYKSCDRKKCKVVGKHKGLWFYTIGQRKGIGLGGGPYYVVGKDFRTNTLIVSKDEKDLLQKVAITEKVNWISGKPPKLPLRVKAKIRYKHTSSSAEIHKLKTKNYKLIFGQPQRAVTPGQSVVFYQGDTLLGGGVIANR